MVPFLISSLKGCANHLWPFCWAENAGLNLLVFEVLHVVSETDRKSDPKELSEEKEVCQAPWELRPECTHRCPAQAWLVHIITFIIILKSIRLDISFLLASAIYKQAFFGHYEKNSRPKKLKQIFQKKQKQIIWKLNISQTRINFFLSKKLIV